MQEVVILLSSSPPQGSNGDTEVSRSGRRLRPSTVSKRGLYDIGSSDFEDNFVITPDNIRKPRAAPKASHDLDDNKLRDSRVFDDSLLDNLEEHDFPVEQPRKRRRVTPSPVGNPQPIQKDIIGAEDVLDLSSEPDHDKETSFRPRSFSKDGFNMLPLDSEIDLPPFSSSAPIPQTSTNLYTKTDAIIELSSEDGMDHHDPVISSSQPVGGAKAQSLSERTSILLASLPQSGRQSNVTKPTSARAAPYTKTIKTSRVTRSEEDDNIVNSSQPLARRPSPRKSAAAPAARKATATADKQKDKEQKQLEKEAAKERKKLEKEQKAAEKQLAADRAEVNKKKTDKKQSSGEMIVELPYLIKGKALGNQVEESMKEVDVETRYYQQDVDMTNDNPNPSIMGTIVKWYRKVNSRYNQEAEEYESCPLKTERENHTLVHLTAEEFCALAVVDTTSTATSSNQVEQPSEEVMASNIDTYVTLLRSQHQNTTIILLIQGLAAYLRKSANTKNREFASAVRALNPDALDSPPASTSTTSRPSKKRRAAASQRPLVDLSFLTQEHIDPLTLHLQLSHQPIHIHHTTSVATSAQQILSFTRHLSTRPYRLNEQAHNLAHASFCMASGQFRTGQGDATETWLKMLEQVNRVTASMALGIVKEGYENPKQLVEAFEKAERRTVERGGTAKEGKEKARLMLQDVRKALNKNGERSDKRLGPATSKRVYKIFMARDENLRDGIV